jgi:hypothetical protein
MFKYESIVTVVDDDGYTEGFCVCFFKNNKFISKEYYSSKPVADEVSDAWKAKNYAELAIRFHC